MGKIVLTEDLRKQLGSFNHEVEVCDEKGQVVGYFMPRDVRAGFLKALFPDDPEERRRIEEDKKNSKAWLTTAEAIAYLENYGRDKGGKV